jgi:hypothetical protein
MLFQLKGPDFLQKAAKAFFRDLGILQNTHHYLKYEIADHFRVASVCGLHQVCRRHCKVFFSQFIMRSAYPKF